jgi:hypothetical protein
MIKKITPYFHLLFAGTIVYLWVTAPAIWYLWLPIVILALRCFQIDLLLSRGWRFIPPAPEPDDSDYLADQQSDKEYYS